jgi:hypothetical protein
MYFHFHEYCSQPVTIFWFSKSHWNPLKFQLHFSGSENAKRHFTTFKSLVGMEEGKIPYNRLGLDKIELAWIQQKDWRDRHYYEREQRSELGEILHFLSSTVIHFLNEPNWMLYEISELFQLIKNYADNFLLMRKLKQRRR